MLVLHAELGVPVEDQFVMWELNYTADPAELALDGPSSEIVAEISFPELELRAGRVRGLRTSVVMTRDGRRVATGDSTARCTRARRTAGCGASGWRPSAVRSP